MKLTTHQLEGKYFYNKIKILHHLWGAQMNLEKEKT